MSAKNPQVFVIQRFGGESEAIYGLIQSAATKSGADVIRADSIDSEANITESIFGADSERLDGHRRYNRRKRERYV